VVLLLIGISAAFGYFLALYERAAEDRRADEGRQQPSPG
jgi:hypothetical protein